ncbi:hypothetical protein [Anabaena sp. CCY 9910]|uniref:hypothetical protein n=1 Tax=Anabaena sp. CCY 9910 TaxID=3103870 RepID=UPI0039E09A95
MNKIEIIAQELTNSQYSELVTAQNYPAIANLLNAKPLIDNPTPQSNIPKPLSLDALYSCITREEGLQISQHNLLDRTERVANENNRPGLLLLVDMLDSILSTQSKTNIQNLIDEEILDPEYQPQIPGTSKAEELSIHSVRDWEVQLALHQVFEDGITE